MEHNPRLWRRFWAKVDKSGGGDACWPWTGTRFRAGYGCFWLGGNVSAHRVAWSLWNQRPIPAGKLILHSRECTTRLCCNPRHLRPGTHADNAADRNALGRNPLIGAAHAKGERVNTAKLTTEQVRDIRSRPLTGRRGEVADLAREFGLTRQSMRALVRGRNWKHVRAP